MGATNKIIIGTVGTIFSIVILATVAPNQIHQQQVLDQQVNQDTNQLNNIEMKLINDCDTVFTSIGDLTGCKSNINDIKNKCQDGEYSSMSVCNDPQINHFLSTVDGKIANAEGVISNTESKLIDACIDLIASGGSNQECIPDMQQIQQDCNQYNIDNHMAVCSDPRINEILTGSIKSQLPISTNPNLSQPGQNASSLIQSANQYTLSYIDSCMKATDPAVIQSCTLTAKKLLDYCNNVSSVGIEQICSDPRLQQLANMEQTTNQAAQSNSNPQAETSNSQTQINSSSKGLVTVDSVSRNSDGITTVKISGKLGIFESPAIVTLVITYPNGSTKDNAQINVNDDGTFNYAYMLGPTSPIGTYIIQAYYNNSVVSQTSFNFD